MPEKRLEMRLKLDGNAKGVLSSTALFPPVKPLGKQFRECRHLRELFLLRPAGSCQFFGCNRADPLGFRERVYLRLQDGFDYRLK